MSWQKSLAEGFSSAGELLKALGLPVSLGSEQAEKEFKTRVPRAFVARMTGKADDPLLMQVLAAEEELNHVEGFTEDPLEETKRNPFAGLIHKYYGRVLLTFTGACAINCRYCFRRHFPYQANNPGRKGWLNVLSYIEKEASIEEVILSGGDPLLASDLMLHDFLHSLTQIKHLRTIRFHTRTPIVLPERVDESFLNLLHSVKLNKVFVFHINHAQEIDAHVQAMCDRLRKAGCILLNQSVLLKGINNDHVILAALSQRLMDCQILPYYLHVLDKTKGVAHFDVPKQDVLTIYEQLQCILPGYLVPRLVQEEPGKKHKTLLI